MGNASSDCSMSIDQGLVKSEFIGRGFCYILANASLGPFLFFSQPLGERWNSSTITPFLSSGNNRLFCLRPHCPAFIGASLFGHATRHCHCGLLCPCFS